MNNEVQASCYPKEGCNKQYGTSIYKHANYTEQELKEPFSVSVIINRRWRPFLAMKEFVTNKHSELVKAEAHGQRMEQLWAI